MIKMLQRYIARTIFVATGLTAFVIAAVLLVMNLLTQLRDIGQGGYHFAQATIYVLMCLPHVLYQFLPVLILLGSLIGLSVLNTHYELLVIQTMGFSTRQIVYSVLGAAFALVLVTSMISECIAPYFSYRAEIRKENALHGGQAVVTATGVWFHIHNNFIHARQIIGRQLLKEVTRYQFNDKQQLQTVYFAKALLLQDNEWVMYDVLKTTFSPGRTHSERLFQEKLKLKFSTSLLNISLAEPNEMTLIKLVHLSRYLKQNRLQSKEYQYEFWRRLLQPIASLIMIFLAVPLVLHTVTTTPWGWRILVGIVVGLFFYVVNELLGQLCVVYQLPAMLAALLPLMIFALVGLFLSWQYIR